MLRIKNAKRKYKRNSCPHEDARFAGSTSGGFGACAAALAMGGSYPAGSQFEAGDWVEMKPSLPCGGNFSLPSQGRLLLAVGWSSPLVAPPCVVLEAFG